MHGPFITKVSGDTSTKNDDDQGQNADDPGDELDLLLRLELGRQGAEPHQLFGERPQLLHKGRKDEEGVQPKKGRQTNLDLEP